MRAEAGPLRGARMSGTGCEGRGEKTGEVKWDQSEGVCSRARGETPGAYGASTSVRTGCSSRFKYGELPTPSTEQHTRSVFLQSGRPQVQLLFANV